MPGEEREARSSYRFGELKAYEKRAEAQEIETFSKKEPSRAAEITPYAVLNREHESARAKAARMEELRQEFDGNTRETNKVRLPSSAPDDPMRREKPLGEAARAAEKPQQQARRTSDRPGLHYVPGGGLAHYSYNSSYNSSHRAPGREAAPPEARLLGEGKEKRDTPSAPRGTLADCAYRESDVASGWTEGKKAGKGSGDGKGLEFYEQRHPSVGKDPSRDR